MPQTSEKWEVQVGNKKYIVSENGKDAILEAKERGIPFVKFKDFVINPAFVSDICLVERVNNLQIAAPSPDIEISEEQREKNIKRLQEIRKKLLQHVSIK